MTTNTADTGAAGDGEDRTDWWYIFALLIIAALGQVFTVFYVPAGNLNTLGTVTGVALAALMAGGLIGFLFGIPRRLQDGAPPPTATAEAEERSLYAGNTNLEQISDWLTKIIVGVSLVELGPIVDFVKDTGTAVAKSIGMADKPAFPIAIIVLYVICGFMIGYLWARLYLPKALNNSERVKRRLLAQLDELTKQNEADVTAVKAAQAQLADQASTRPTAEQLATAIAAASTETRAYVFYLAENLRWKTWRDKKPVMERTIPVFQALIASDKDGLYHRNFGQLAYALKDQRTPDYTEAEKLFSKAIEVRGGAADNDWQAYEANRAVCRIHLDANFAQQPPLPADAAQRDAIMADIKVAAQDGWTREWLEKDPTVAAWLALNQQQFPVAPSPTP